MTQLKKKPFRGSSRQDLVFRYFADSVNSGSLSWLGVFEGVELESSLSTELPSIQSTVRLDSVFLTKDGKILHVEYQSSKSDSDMWRFLEYDVRLLNVHKKPIRTVVLYSNGIKQAESELLFESVEYRVRNLYLASFDGDSVILELEKALSDSVWLPKHTGMVAFLFHMGFRQLKRLDAIRKAKEIAGKIPMSLERNKAILILELLSQHLLVDKTSDEDKNLKEMLGMSDLLEELVEERIAVERAKFEEKLMAKLEEERVKFDEEVMAKVEEEKLESAKKCLLDGMDVDLVVKWFGLPREKVLEIKDALLDSRLH